MSIKGPKRNRVHGFTIIELLALFVVIGIIAALGVGLASLASRMSKEQRVRSELNQLVTAIDAYKAHFGFYPPDNPENSVTNQLYYELTGTIFSGAGFKPITGGGEIPPQVIARLFNVKTLSNSARDAQEVRHFVDLKFRQHHVVFTNPIVEVLIAPVDCPTNRATFAPPLPYPVSYLNPWRYVSTKPSHNPKSFDLWAEIVIGKQQVVIGNWKQ